jgi:ABC-type branched-subunit amino acid transport system permease subunit
VPATEAIGGPAFEASCVELRIVPVARGTPDATPQVSAGLADNPDGVAVIGDATLRTSLIKFAIGAFIAGLGGALMGYQQTMATAESYSVLAGIGLFAIAYAAGITCVSGGVLAGIAGAGGGVLCLRSIPRYRQLLRDAE